MRWLKMILDMIDSIQRDYVKSKNKPVEETPQVEPTLTISSEKPNDKTGNDGDVWMMYKEVK